MKYIVVLGDGMADEPLAALGGKTPLEYAKTPAMDALASGGEMGMVQNVPQGMHPGSEVANRKRNPMPRSGFLTIPPGKFPPRKRML